MPTVFGARNALSNVDFPVPTSAQVGISSFIAIFHLLGVSVLSGFLTHRVRLEDFKSFHRLRQISLPRLYLVLLFFTAWLYFIITGLVLQGIGLDHEQDLCQAGIYVSTSLYCMAKLFVYFFLTERAYIVWCPTLVVPRYKSPVYIACTLAIVVYVGVVVHLFIVRIAHLGPAGQCMIGFHLNGVITILVYDVCVSILMTGLFIWPLACTRFHSLQLRHITRRSVTAATIVLGTSTVNMCGLVWLHGQERGFAYLMAWEGDVLIGSIALFWLTSGSGLRPISSLIHHPHSYPYSRSSSSKRPSQDKSFPELSLLPCLDIVYPESLPTTTNYGTLDGGDASKTGGVVTLPPPSPAVTHEPRMCMMPPPSPTFTSVLGMPTPDSEISEKVHSSYLDARS